jgi:hypothetical protein
MDAMIAVKITMAGDEIKMARNFHTCFELRLKLFKADAYGEPLLSPSGVL